MNNSSSEFISPEERLLRIIKGKSKEGNHNGSKPIDKKIFESQENNVRNRKIILPNTTILHYINNGLFIFWCIVIIVGFLLIRPTIFLEPPKASIKIGKQLEQLTKEENGSKKPYSYYSEIIEKRNLFKAKTDSGNSKEILPVSSSELLENYSLSGIISGKNPQAIVVDKKTNKTYFLDKGQYLNNFEVIEIYEDKIILELDGKEFELSL